MRLLDAKHDQRLGDVVGKISLVMQVQLLETLEDVIEAAQASSPFRVTRVQHRGKPTL